MEDSVEYSSSSCDAVVFEGRTNMDDLSDWY